LIDALFLSFVSYEKFQYSGWGNQAWTKNKQFIGWATIFFLSLPVTLKRFKLSMFISWQPILTKKNTFFSADSFQAAAKREQILDAGR
jgi:hypothetical protein